MITEKATPLLISETKKYKIVLARKVFDTHFPITSKNYLAKYYNYEINDIYVNTNKMIPFNTYKLNNPIYSIRVEFYNTNNNYYNLSFLSSIVNIKYNGAFFSIMNRIRDAKFVEYSYYQGGSKKLNKFPTSTITKKSKNKGLLNRLRYENGSGGIYYLLSGEIRALLKFCPKYELRRIVSVIRHDYYKLMCNK